MLAKTLQDEPPKIPEMNNINTLSVFKRTRQDLSPASSEARLAGLN